MCQWRGALFCIIGLLLYRGIAYASFTEIPTSLPSVAYSSIAWGDYDNDGNLDILLTGKTENDTKISSVYHADGYGNFIDISAGLPGVSDGAVAWGDYDNDGDLDILLAGYSTSGRIAKVYRNNGNDSFTDINAGLPGVLGCSVAWGDYDNDGDLDILITGNISSTATPYISEIYRNNGNGTFSSIYACLQGVCSGSATWGDYDNDGDLDILLTGYTISNPILLSKIYRNDGNGTFTDINAGLAGVQYSSVAWGDYDNDGDLDILLSGQSFNTHITKVYRNDGNSIFSDINAGLPGLDHGSVAWGDYDKDGDLDFLLTGYSSVGYTARLYQNIGNSTFTYFDAGFPGVDHSSVAWGDYDKDGDLDVLLTGNHGISFVTSLYRNNTCINFTAMHSNVRPGATGSVAWGDYDNDGDLDIIKTGYEAYTIFNSEISTNIGNGTFSNGPSIQYLYRSTVAWGDYDNDGDLDILLTGFSGYSNVSKIYRNNGNRTFTEVPSGLQAVANGSVAWGDYDNDGDLDILLTGSSYGNFGYSKIYRNNGNGTFTDINAALIGVSKSSVTWGDYDNDGDLDILLTGQAGSTSISKVYRNDSNDVFTDIIAGLPGVANSSVAWGDYDNDGDLDILITGSTPSDNYISQIYRNIGNDLFTDIDAGLPGVKLSSVAWGDYDNDGNLDILLSGQTSTMGYVSKIFHNNGNSTFTDIDVGLAGVYWGSSAWGDFDNDGDLDILLTGYLSSSTYFSKIYRNDVVVPNTAPTAPTNLRTSVDGDFVTFHWDASTDAQSPSSGLNYVLRIGIRPSGNQVSSPMASDSGYRMIPVKGYANASCSWKISMSSLVGNDVYYWSVQAIDTAFSGSAFSTEALYYPIGVYSPPQPPAEVNITMNANDAVIHWTAVTENTLNEPLVPDFYNVYCNAGNDLSSPFSYLGSTTGTSYTHNGVGQESRVMMYKVKAIKHYPYPARGTDNPQDIEKYLDEHLHRGMTEQQVSYILDKMGLKR